MMDTKRVYPTSEQSVKRCLPKYLFENMPPTSSLNIPLTSKNICCRPLHFNRRTAKGRGTSCKMLTGRWSTFCRPAAVIIGLRIYLVICTNLFVRSATASQLICDPPLISPQSSLIAFLGPSPWFHNRSFRGSALNPLPAQSSPPGQRTFTSDVQPVIPLKPTSSKLNKGTGNSWEQSSVDKRIAQSPSLSATATFLEILEAATKGISSSVTSSNSHKRPKGRPDSVPGAMSRSTILSMNEMESNRMTGSVTTNPTAVRFIEDLYDEPNFSSPYTVDSRTLSDPDMISAEDSARKGRGRPRKFPVPSMDGLSMISTDDSDVNNVAYNINPSRSSPSILRKQKASKSPMSRTVDSYRESGVEENSSVKIRKKVVKALPKAKPRRNDESTLTEDSDTSNAEESPRNDRVGFMVGSDDLEPPNLQRYYRTELLSAEEEYALGIKVQFVMKCEQVHEGLFLLLDRVPTIVEWANACGFREHDPVMNAPDFVATDVEEMIRPSQNEGTDDDMDPSMFVGNGLLNASGVGRGKGRVKKPPPVELKDYYDDTSVKFSQHDDDFVDYGQSLTDDQNKNEIRRTKTRMRPINRGTPRDFVNTMLAGKEAKQRMVQCNMRLVVSIAKRYKYVGVNIADLVQEGSIGLTRAAEKFDPRKGFKFSTYASWWIQQAVFRSIAYHSRTIRLPVHVHNLLNRVRRVRLQLQQILGRTPTNEEMASELDMTLPKYSKMLRLTRRAISLEMPKYQNNPKDIGHESEMLVGDTIDASEVIRDENSPEQSVDQVLFYDDLHEMLKILGDDEQRVVRARYGLDDGLTRTVSTVAAQLGQSKSWVRSMECRALRKLRRPWYEKRLWEHQNSLRR